MRLAATANQQVLSDLLINYLDKGKIVSSFNYT